MAEFEVIAEGSGTDLTPLENVSVAEGSVIETRLFVQNAPTAEQLAAIANDLLARGVALLEPLAYDSGIIVVRFRAVPVAETAAAPPTSIGVAWLAPIALTSPIGLIIGAVLVIGIGIFAWQAAQGAASSLSSPLVLLGIAGIVIVYAIVTGTKKEATQ